MNPHGLIVHDCFQITKNLSFRAQSYGFYSIRVQIKYVKKKKECESCKKFIDKLLYNKPVISRFARGGQRGELNNYKLSQKGYIAFGAIAAETKIQATKLSSYLQLSDDERLRSYVEPLLRDGIINKKGTKKGTT